MAGPPVYITRRGPARCARGRPQASKGGNLSRAIELTRTEPQTRTTTKEGGKSSTANSLGGAPCHPGGKSFTLQGHTPVSTDCQHQCCLSTLSTLQVLTSSVCDASVLCRSKPAKWSSKNLSRLSFTTIGQTQSTIWTLWW